MEPGETYYRMVGHGTRPAGSHWVREVPADENEVRSRLAVKNEWNGDRGIVAFTPTRRIDGWIGAAAPQRASGGARAYLVGGGEQIWIPTGTLDAEAGAWRIAPFGKTEGDADERNHRR